MSMLRYFTRAMPGKAPVKQNFDDRDDAKKKEYENSKRNRFLLVGNGSCTTQLRI